MDTEQTLHPADPRLRRLALWLPLLTMALGVAALWGLRQWLAQPHGDNELQGLLIVFFGLTALLCAVSLALAWSLWTQAARIAGENRYPPSDMRTLRAVPIRRGDAARRIGSWMRIAAGMLAVLSAALMVWMFWSVRMLG